MKGNLRELIELFQDMTKPENIEDLQSRSTLVVWFCPFDSKQAPERVLSFLYDPQEGINAVCQSECRWFPYPMPYLEYKDDKTFSHKQERCGDCHAIRIVQDSGVVLHEDGYPFRAEFCCNFFSTVDVIATSYDVSETEDWLTIIVKGSLRDYYNVGWGDPSHPLPLPTSRRYDPPVAGEVHAILGAGPWYKWTGKIAELTITRVDGKMHITVKKGATT
jgi:hypothetical protein